MKGENTSSNLLERRETLEHGITSPKNLGLFCKDQDPPGPTGTGGRTGTESTDHCRRIRSTVYFTIIYFQK